MKPNKYRNIKTVVDNIQFDSRKEANRYGELQLLVRGERITDLKLRPCFEFVVNGQMICKYIGDFSYVEKDRVSRTVEDVKSPITRKNPVYRIKRKLFEALYPEIVFIES